MLFDIVLVFVLLFIINGLVYQFIYKSYLWIGIGTLLFYILYVTFKVMFNLRQKRMQKATQLASLSTVAEVKPSKFPIKKVEVEVKPAEKKVEVPTEKVDADMNILRDFIIKNKAEGFKAKIIRDALLKQGWPKEKVDKALAANF